MLVGVGTIQLLLYKTAASSQHTIYLPVCAMYHFNYPVFTLFMDIPSII